MDSSKIVNIASFIAMKDDFSLLKFINIFSCLLVSPKLNTTNCFQFIDILQPLFQNSTSSLKPTIWAELFNSYLGSIQIYMSIILYFGAQFGYKEPNISILSKNLASALVDTGIIDKKVAEDLRYCRIEEVINPTLPFISFSLGLVPKHNGSLRKIYHFVNLLVALSRTISMIT